MSILLVGNLSPQQYAEWTEVLSSGLPAGEQLVLATGPFDPEAVEVALVANPPPGSLARLPNLRFIQSLWAGVDRLLCDDSVPRAIPLARLVDRAMSQGMVECAIANVFYLHRRFPEYIHQQSERTWGPLDHPLAGNRSVGVLGLGHLGCAVALELVRLGFRVKGWSRAQRDVNEVESFSGEEGLRRLLAHSRILINLLPLTPETRGILNAALFRQLPRGAEIINLARGGHLVDADLLAALEEGQVGYAMLDVFNQEPLPSDHPFWTHPRVRVFPHIAVETDPHTAARVVCENIAAFRQGRPVTGLVSRSRGY